jgi:hypothetical protein
MNGDVALLTVQSSAFGPVGVRIRDLPTGDTLEGFPGAGCATPLSFYTELQLTGDLVVVDGRALPTSKDQCKKGGWQTYGVFKNQGDCVSFVATGGRNPPAGWGQPSGPGRTGYCGRDVPGERADRAPPLRALVPWRLFRG